MNETSQPFSLVDTVQAMVEKAKAQQVNPLDKYLAGKNIKSKRQLRKARKAMLREQHKPHSHSYSIIGEHSESTFFRVDRYDSGEVIVVMQESVRPERQQGFVIGVTPLGICVNGDYGTNPSPQEIAAFTELMCEMVDSWRRMGLPA